MMDEYDADGAATGGAADDGASLAEMAEAAEQLEAGAPAAGDGEGPEAQPRALEPLPREEIERRWRQTQGALRSSRADLKALKAELAALRAQATQPAASAEAAPPDPRTDPAGAMEWMHGQLAAAQQREAVAGFVAEVETQEAEMAEANPDYHEAVDFLRESRRAELIELGAAEDQADAIVGQEFLAGVAEARRQGLNPAKVAYKLARDRGFARRGRLGPIEAGAAAARTLSGAGGRGGADGGTLEARIANLSGAALREAWRKHKAQMA